MGLGATYDPVALLGWVTPGVATEGVTPLFFPEKPGDLFLLIAVTITIAFYCFHSSVTPFRVSPHTFFLPVRPRFSTILCKFAHIFFLRVSPPRGCHPGRPPSWRHWYDVHLRFIGKRAVDYFLLVLIDLLARCYGWWATGENSLKIGVLQRGMSVSAKFSRRRGRPHQSFIHR